MRSPTPPLPLNYATPVARGRVLAWPCHLLLGAVVSVSLVVLAVSLLIVPRFAAIFKDFKTDLPMVTKLVLSFCWWLGPGWGWCAALLLAMAVVAVGVAIDVIASEVSRVRRYTVTMTIVLLLADVVWAVVAIVAMFAPMLSLMDSVSGSKR